MKYALNRENHADFSKYELNRLAPRAYFIPDVNKNAKQAADLETERYTSSMVTVLSGKWDFKYYKSKAKLPAVLDTARVSFDTVKVPSTWQHTGGS